MEMLHMIGLRAKPVTRRWRPPPGVTGIYYSRLCKFEYSIRDDSDGSSLGGFVFKDNTRGFAGLAKTRGH